jgi:telomerase reverse transcriptase
VIDLLFKRDFSARQPGHQLCQGVQWPNRGHQYTTDSRAATDMLGLDSNCPDKNAAIVRGPLWSRLLSILGNEGEKVMVELLLYPGIFLQVGNEESNFCQISGKSNSSHNAGEIVKRMRRHSENILGIPLHNLEAFPGQTSITAPSPALRNGGKSVTSSKTPAAITVVRSRMFYARPALSSRNQVQLGLRHIREWIR